MTIRNRLARSNIAMLVIPILAAALLLFAGAWRGTVAAAGESDDAA